MVYGFRCDNGFLTCDRHGQEEQEKEHMNKKERESETGVEVHYAGINECEVRLHGTVL